MNVLEIVLPVLVMIVVGMLCRKWKILTRDGINNMKVLVTNVMLPVAIFHALATAEYNKETGILILIMFVMLVVSFGLGFLLKPFLKGTYQKLMSEIFLYGFLLENNKFTLIFKNDKYIEKVINSSVF